MKGDRVERNLRERGPRELGGGGVPSLPPDVEEAKARLRAIDRGRRVRTLVGGGLGTLAAAAAVVAIAVAVTGPLTPAPVPGASGSGVASGTTPARTPAPTVPPASPTPGMATARAAAPCAPADLAAVADRWGAAAGSRGTLVTVTNISGTPCTLAGRPGARLENDAGTLAATVGDATTTVPQPLEPGGSLVTSVTWSNWCGSDPALPIQVVLVLPGGDLQVAPDPTTPNVLVPPCMGPNDRNHLSTIDFQAPSSP